MDKNFFDESIFNSVESEEESIVDYTSLVFHLKKHNNGYQFYVENNSDRLNGNELKSLLKLNETKKKFLSENDIALLNYVTHRLLATQTIYNIFNDIGFIIGHLKNSKVKIYFENILLKISDKSYKLNIDNASVRGRSSRCLMDILYLLIPMSVLLVFGIIGVFWWALQAGQFDNIEREGERILGGD